jgi:PPOX class probable F420-dependent enzyme
MYRCLSRLQTGGSAEALLHVSALIWSIPISPAGAARRATVNAQEITAYLAASHIAVVATMNRHGHPHLTPNWYRYDGKVLTLITRKDRLKYLNLQRDNHISVCIYDPPVASNYVVISGTVTCNDQDIWDEARRIIARYRAPDEVDDYVARWKTEPRVLITVTPEHIATRVPR